MVTNDPTPERCSCCGSWVIVHLSDRTFAGIPHLCNSIKFEVDPTPSKKYKNLKLKDNKFIQNKMNKGLSNTRRGETHVK